MPACFHRFFAHLRRLARPVTGGRALCVLELLALTACQQAPSPPLFSPRAAVGPLGENRWLTATSQVLTPVGKQIPLPGVRPQALALSPDARLLAVAGTATELSIFDPATGAVRQKIHLPPGSIGASVADAANLTSTTDDKPSVAGLVFSPDGSRLFCSNANGSVKVFAIDRAGVVSALADFPLPRANAPTRRAEVPAGLALSSDSRRLYVVANLSNQLLELDATSGHVLRQWPVGVAPLDVVLVRTKAYVSNQGGARADDTAITGPAGRGTVVRVDDRSIASQGSVSVIDLAGDRVALPVEIAVGRHASALAASPDGRHVVVANAGDDTLQVVDTRTDRVAEKIWTRQTPADPFGAQPCALAFDAPGERLFVCNSTQNAVAVVDFEPAQNASRVLGLVPVAWFPAAVVFDRAHRQLCVANMKGLGIAPAAAGQPAKFHTRDYYGTLSLLPVPAARDLAALTATALSNLRYPQLAAARLPPRSGRAPQPVPERVGEPSVFRHVIYVIKENRSYDQMLGDMKEGNGDATLCTFGEEFTPNQHALARQFVLLDNTYCAGVQSADGHQWTDSAFANDYTERQLTAGYPRSYPGSKGDPDALAYASSGFIWDNALAHGKTFRNYGEWMTTECGWADATRRGHPAWADYWQDLNNGTQLARVRSRPGLESLRVHSNLATVGWDLNVPDAVRAEQFIAELKEFERTDRLPDFLLLFLPNDHTASARAGMPTPGAYVADNDLALGRVVDALSHSKFWRDTCLFAIEDDPQAGWDHVSGYRTTCFVASAYTKRGVTISQHYNQPGLIRTMELMLGLPPMNQIDATSTPLSECFTATPDFTPFVAVPNRVSLHELNPEPKKIADVRQRADAIASARMRLDQPDLADENELNRILWRAMKGDTAFPAWAVKAIDDDE